MYQTIKYEVKDKVATVTINRPEALNALNSTVLDELFDVFNVIDKDDEVRCVIVTGEGRSFVAGADIAEMSTLNPVEGKRFAQKGHRVMNFIEKTEKPVIAAVNGFALGGGCELSMACDIRLASVKAVQQRFKLHTLRRLALHSFTMKNLIHRDMIAGHQL